MVPQIREGVFSTELFKRYQRSEQALVLALMEMVINGVSTRKVKAITEELCGTSFSASTVSELCKQLDPIVKEWNERDLSGKEYPFLIVDAIVFKVRDDHCITTKSALIAIGINEDGYREVLGLKLGNSETRESWSAYFSWLKSRGLKGVEFIVSDCHGGLVNAIETHFQGVLWQRCQTHFTRNILDACPKRYQEEMHQALRSLFEAPDRESAERIYEKMIDEFQEKAPRALSILEEGLEDALTVLHIPAPYRKKLRTTNSIERLNEEIRRRERVIRIFPNEASVIRLIGALLMEQDEQWSTGRIYLNMDAFKEWQKAKPLSTSVVYSKAG